MSEIPNNIQKEHIEQAILRIDEEGIPNNAASSTYDVVFNNKIYPPKLVISYANKYANGLELDRNSFQGGKGTACFNHLLNLGFTIEKKKETERSAFIDWINENLKPKKYPAYLDKFWTKLDKQASKFKEDYSLILESCPGLEKIISEATPVYDLDLESLKKLKDCLSRILNKRASDSEGGSAESAGLSQLIEWREAKQMLKSNLESTIRNNISISKPFLLLAGLSGTGKTRFVREQAKMTGSLESTYCLVSVRPDWHEPSDLLGYISRLGQNGAEFITTDVLSFMVKAWLEIIDLENSFTVENPSWKTKPLAEIRPFWLCLDEMNLAPVEQYFADYLSVIETRLWENDQYTCDALLKADTFKQLESEGLLKLREALGLNGSAFDGLWDYFVNRGISIPFNLIVAGTVNMDETTHGFSRKVIDRALTFDFGQFFPHESKTFFDPIYQPKALSYPLVSHARTEHFQNFSMDPGGKKTIAFFDAVNSVLKGTMFELAYRALNELLVTVISFNPKTEAELLAVWDDFLMCKVLPRIEGDEDKLTSQNGLLLDALMETLKLTECLASIWKSKTRPDLLRETITSPDSAILIDCRSRVKIEWMQNRLNQNGFTSFWP
jgi:hypothetical protein